MPPPMDLATDVIIRGSVTIRDEVVVGPDQLDLLAELAELRQRVEALEAAE